jgi:hypothetical protein
MSVRFASATPAGGVYGKVMACCRTVCCRALQFLDRDSAISHAVLTLTSDLSYGTGSLQHAPTVQPNLTCRPSCCEVQ